MLNQESVEFASHLEAPAEPSVKELCGLGAAVTRAKDTTIRRMAAKTSAKKPAKKGFFDTLFSFAEKAVGKAEKIAGGAAKIVGRASQLSAKYGGPVPLDKEIAKLSEMKRELNKVVTEANRQQLNINTLLKLHKPHADLAAQQLTQASKQARAEAQGVLAKVDRAQALAQAARKKLLAGVAPTVELAQLSQQMAMVDSIYGHARLRRMELQPIYDKAYNAEVLAPAKVGAGDYARATGGALIEFGKQAGEAAQQAGEMVKETGRGIKDASPLLRYLPYIALGGAALYLYSAGRGSGGALSEVLKSYKRKDS